MARGAVGVRRRGATYWLFVVVPKDLQKAYSKTRIQESLETSDPQEAALKGTRRRAELLEEFETNRKALNPQRLGSITSDMVQALAGAARRRVLQGDQDRREGRNPAIKELSLLGLPLMRAADGSIPLPERDPLEGLTDWEANNLTTMNTMASQEAGANYAHRNLLAVLPLIQEDAKAMGFTVDRETPGIQEALSAYQGAYREAWHGTTQRDAGEVVETPAPPTPAVPPEPPKTLRDVFERWKPSGVKPRSEDSIAAMGRAVAQFETRHPGTALQAINGDMGDQYTVWLRDNCNTPKTARDRLNAINSLLKYAAERLDWIPKQPWRGLNIKAPTTNKRRPWTADELQAFFTAPLFTHYSLPDLANGGKDAAYWIPLLGLYTGARLGELCQLRTEDIKTLEDIPVMVLTDEGDDQSIKSTAGHRSIPIHSELMRLGFLDYVNTIRATGSDSLWPAMKKRKGKPSDFFGRWFKKARTAQGLDGERPDFHCLRHTVRTLMRRERVSEETQDKVTGHATKGSIGTVVYSHWTLKEIQEAVEAIQYPALKLPKAYTSPHMEEPLRGGQKATS